jgi:hypothetical protein
VLEAREVVVTAEAAGLQAQIFIVYYSIVVIFVACLPRPLLGPT